MSRITLADRTAIEAGIYGRLSFQEIADKIGKSPRYVSEEIRRNRTLVPGSKPFGKDCIYAANCKYHNLCGKGCGRRCISCQVIDCRTICKYYDNRTCSRIEKPPYVCNVCPSRRICRADRAYYMAQQADAMARRRNSISRSKPQIREDEMDRLNDLVTPLIKKGQPLTHIFSTHGNEIPVSQRTLYYYIEQGLLSAGNLDLRRKLGYRPRKKKKEPSQTFSNQKFRQHRTYSDFKNYMFLHPDTPYVEMDTVKGVREKGKRILTMVFVEHNLMLIFLMRDGKAETVVEQLDWLTSALGLKTFRKLFPVILTDNGSEFKHTREMEYTQDGKQRTKLFYCDPQAAWQKPHIEKNHEYIRYVIPKSKSFSPYTQEDMVVLMNHINSTRRTKLGEKSPYELVSGEEFVQLMAVMGLQRIPADEVRLTPRLLQIK